MSVTLLDQRLHFPPASEANPDGLLAIGGDLSVERLLLAYRSGIFPWSAEPLTWWSPDPRAVFEFNFFHLSHSLYKTIRHGTFEVTRDRAFGEVVHACAAPGAKRPTTWISPEFIEAYARLHRLGHAHSVECWRGGRLVGGIYGVALGGFFAGESMFHRVSNASKVALFHLFEHLQQKGFLLFDIQMLTPITAQLGGKLIPRKEYLRRLAEAVEKRCAF